MRKPLFVPAFLFAPLMMLGQSSVPIDTAAVVAHISQYMMLVDRSPIMASYVRMTPDGPAEPAPRGSAMPPGCAEFIELLVDSAHHVTGAVNYKPDPITGVKETTYHYFDATHNTVAVRHELKWVNNHCAFSYAVRNDIQYFYPPRNTILEYSTLTDVEGNNLDPARCSFPDIKRVLEVYPHLDMYLLMERVRMD